MQDDTDDGPDRGPETREPLRLDTERDLRANIRQICRRLDAQPALSRLLFINPVLVLEDVGVEMSPAVREHIIQALRFPPKRRLRIAAVQAEVEALGRECADADAGADEDADAAAVAPARISPREQLAARQADLARLQQGAMVFFPRRIYEQFKSGEKKHRWIKAVRFGV